VRVAKPEEAGEDTRPRADLSDAETVTRYVANRLANARLLVTGGETGKGTLSVEVAHEALIRNWERLRGWLNEDREFLLWRQRLQVQVKEWEERGRDVDYLLRGTPLSEAERWLLGRPQDLTDPGQKFIRESIALRQHEHAEDEKHRQAEIENAKRLKEAAEARADVERELAEKARALAREQMERAEVERSSVKAAEEAKEAERARREARIVELENNRRKQRRLILIIAAVALIALALGVVALFGRRTAIEQKKLADDRLQNMHKMLEAIPEPEVKERLTLLYFSAEVKTLSRAQKTRLAIEIQRRASTTYAKPRVPAEYGLKLWTAGSTLRVRFLGGTEEQRNLVRETAPEWSKYANLKFEFGNDADAELRVTFDPSGGSWAYVGVEALGIPRDQPTINLGFVETGNTLHEFGHVLGLIHEHQSPNANLLWDRQKVYAYFKATQGWTKQEVDTGVFTRFQEIEYRPLDSDSIMMYYFPGEMFTDGVARGGKQALSKSDKEFGGKLYPFKWPEAVHFQRFPIRTPHRTQHRHPAFHEQTRQIRFGFSVMSRIASSRAQKIVCHVCAPG
jgi:hypothetical protein